MDSLLVVVDLVVVDMRMLLLGCAVGGILVAAYALLTARPGNEVKPEDEWHERAKLWPAVMTEAELLALVFGPVPPCPPDCPVCRANVLVVEQMRQAEREQGWDW